MKALTQKDYICTPMFIATLFTISKTWRQPKYPSVHEQIKNLWYIHTMEYFSAKTRNEEILPFATLMDLKGTVLSEISQREKDK